MSLFVNMGLELDLSPDPIRVWTGDGTITVDGVTYQPTHGAIDFSPSESATSIDQRTTVSFSVVDEDSRAALLAGVPADDARVVMLVSSDYRTFHRIVQIEGTISAVRVQNLTASFEVETAAGDVDRRRPVFISHETQLEAYPGDMGLADMAALEKGLRVRF